MSRTYSAFSYKKGDSLVHKIPAWCKILLVPVLSILIFKMPPFFAIGLIFVQFVTAFYMRFSLKEQFKDLKPILFFAVMLYSFNFFSAISEQKSFYKVLTEFSTLYMLLRLLCVVQCASIIFKSSSQLELRSGFESIESFIRKVLPVSKKNRYSSTIALFVCFIPLVFKIWQDSKLAWKARSGKTSLKMYLTLFPVLFSVALKHAYNTAKAIYIRSF